MVDSKATLQIPGFVLVFIGAILNFIALATPAWQVVYARELQQWVSNGLWMNCLTRPSGMLSCTYTFTKGDLDFYTSAEVVNIRTPAFFEWQHHLLYVILIGQLFAFFAMISFCLDSKFVLYFLNNFSALINLGANIAFQIYAHMVEYRFYHVSVSGIYEKHIGYSYFLHLIGSLIILLGFLLSLAYVITLRISSQTHLENDLSFLPYQVFCSVK
ncbi:unnamed protein product [Enterobius vermicularis]|uniref:Claudin n=1 Tax=Enterobius vermicularis TaxID=51028 RepID=A0A0N4V9Q3_ENTVE|nr:unnamed protein product [Enterobius vermicularis]